MPPARVPFELRDRPFTTAQAAAHGVSTSALRGPQWRHVFRDVWAHLDLPDDRETRLAAVALVLAPGAFVCGPTAAWLYGIDVQDRRRDLVWVGSRTGIRPRVRSGTLVREITVEPSDLRTAAAVPMTSELRTAFDCARWLSLVEAVVVADFLAHSGAITLEQLSAYVARQHGLRGMRKARVVLELMDPLSESPMETRFRLLLVFGGLPAPQAQYVVRDAHGGFVARADFAYVEQRLIVEYDGALHWEQRRADDRRRDEIRALGWQVLVFGRDDYYETPEATQEKVRRALASREPYVVGG